MSRNILLRTAAMLVLSAFLFVSNGAKAQCPPASSDITQYTFSTGVGTASDWLTPASVTTYMTSQDDAASSVYNLNFTFTFEGTAYTQFSVNTNGCLRLGSTAVSSGGSSQFTSGNLTSNYPGIIACGKDLKTTSNGIKYGIYGSSPNRIGVITFDEYAHYNASTICTWQIQLYESTGEIKILYGSSPATIPTSGFQAGVKGANSSNVVVIDPTLHTVSTGASSTLYTTWPGQYRYYSFTPPNVTCPPVYNLASNGTALSWVECGTATQWLVEYGSVGFTSGSGTRVMVNTNSYDFSSFSSGIYEFRVRPYCGVGDTGAAKTITVAKNYTFCGGAGTQANPYLICNETDLRNLATVVNAGVSYPNTYFRLQNNIALAQGAFTPIGNSTTPFRGHFDGNSKSITNLTMSNTSGDHNGLFGMLIGGSIKDLTVGGTVAGGDTTGAIVGSAVNSVIRNCVNNAAITGSSYAHGGIAGSIVSTKVLDCRNTGAIAGSYCTGGIVGYANTKSAIHRCSNTGTISNYSQYHGGIAGYFYNAAVNGDTVGIFACRNTGSVTGSSYTGGVVGYIYYSNVDSCYNQPNLLTSGYSYVGGVVGYAYYTKIRRCSNRGNVPGSQYVGGICGYIYGSSSAYGYIQYCVNTGHISATSSNSYVGGIAGWTYYTYVDYNTNSGDVTSTSTSTSSYVGGIIGYSSSNTYVRYNLNGGYIKSSGGAVGGIMGYTSGSTTNIVYNLNVNNVKGSANVAAIAGTGLVNTSNNYWDKQMCPTTYVHGTTANATLGRPTSDFIGVATYPGTGFTAVANMYPIPTGMTDSIGSKLAATPIRLTNNETVNNVKTNFTVGTLNSVSWTSSNTSVISVSGANATVNGFGLTMLTGTTGGMQKHIWLINEPTFCGGDGTQANPWLICRHQTLDSLAQFVNSGIDFEGKYFKVVNDLDLSSYSNWRVIGNSLSYPFKGHFDGNNKTISGLTITGSSSYRGLFGVVLGSSSTNKAEIHHLTVRGSVSGSSYTGAIVGYADLANFKKLTNYADVLTNNMYHGGIAGWCNTYCEFDSCYNHGDIAGNQYTGGIAGYVSTYNLISFCENHGDITSNSIGVGGIVGYNYYYSIISGSNNYGNVTSTSTSTTYYNSSGYGVGGIAGSSYYGSAANVSSIDSCNNYGNVTSSAYCTGGIVGQNYYYGHVNKSFNYGDVIGAYYTGGVCGFIRGSTTTTAANNAHIQNSGNSGSVTGTYYVGGIVGRNGYSSSSYYTYTESCVNTGRVRGTNYVGGIAGQNYGQSSTTYRAVIRGCLNAGVVEATTNYAGGICGQTYNSTSYGIVEYCLNVGKVITPGANKGGVDANSVAPTSSYFDTLMCPIQYYYYGSSATTTTAKRTSALTDGTFNPSATYFTATNGLYPRPTTIANHPLTLLAATPVFLDETATPTDHANNVNNCYTVGTGNGVSWASNDGSKTAISGSNGAVIGAGSATITAVKDSASKEVDLTIISAPVAGTFTYTGSINGMLNTPITSIMPTSSVGTGCTYSCGNLPAGLTIDPLTGEISGTPTAGMNAAVTVAAVCANCVSSTATVVINISPFCGGTGTAADPYLICTERELRVLSNDVNAGNNNAGVYYRLAADITMANGAFNPIGALPSTPFSGTFWGGGHSITNLTVTNNTNTLRGLFGMLKNAYVDSVTVGGTINGGDTTGGIAGSAINSTIKGCVNNAVISGNYKYHGGIVGAMHRSRIIACRNNGEVQGAYTYHGGIAGLANLGSTIRGCLNTGNITGSADYHGGIVGSQNETTTTYNDTVGVFNCINRGAVTGSQYTGGISGYSYYTNFKECINNGTITGGSYAYVAGIAGYSYGNSTHVIRFKNCTDSANVTGSYYVGGITGYTTYARFDSCLNHGVITSTTSSLSSSSYPTGGIAAWASYTTFKHCRSDANSQILGYGYCGGIVGNAESRDTIINCSNAGVVRGYNNTNQSNRGGIAGRLYGNTAATKCFADTCVNTGAISGSQYIGGLFGTTNMTTVKNSRNAGTVTGTSTYVGGITGNAAGVSSSDYIRFENDTNTGTVTGYYYVGGIVAQMGNYGSLFRCPNSGNITSTYTGSTNYTGGIAGYVNGNSYTAADSVQGCHNSGIVTAAYSTAGGILGYANYVRIDTCHNTAKVSGKTNTGGIVGNAQYTKVWNCNNSDSVTGTQYTGGIVGYTNGGSSSYCYLQGCRNTGAVTSTSSGYVGGVLGRAYYTYIDTCHNTGNVSGPGYAGGLIGYVYGYSQIYNCSNQGNVTSTAAYTGGLVGYANNNSTYINLRRCSNTGDVTSTSTQVGGIAGYANYTYCYANTNKGKVRGTTEVGGIIGRAYNYTSCDTNTNFDSVRGTSFVGGIMGYMYSYSYARRNSNRGVVIGTSSSVGGIVGGSDQNASTGTKEIQYNINSGEVNSTSNYVGGIVGQLYYTNCDYNVNHGDVISTYVGQAYVGGIGGYSLQQSYMRYNLNAGLIKAENGDNVGGVAGSTSGTSYVTYNLNVNNVTGRSNVAAIAGNGGVNTSNNYWDKQMCPTTYVYSTTTTNNATLGRSTTDFVGVATYPSTTYFTAATDKYPVPKGLQDSLGAQIAASPIYLQNNENISPVITNFTVSGGPATWTSDNPTAISISGTNATVGPTGSATLTASSGGVEKHIFLIISPDAFCGGSGTKVDPWLICTAAQLDSLAMFVNMGFSYEGKYFRVVNNLDMSNYQPWRMIGNATNHPFKGHFDGAGHTISNLVVNSGSPTYCGLFGYVIGKTTDTCDIHDLVIRGSFTGSSYTGAVVGYISYGKIYNVTNFATISGYNNYHGGIAGYATYTDILRCSNRANVIGGQYTGGIVGNALNGSRHIEYCVNSGHVTSNSTYVGGVAGRNNSIDVQYCTNSGDVTSTSTDASSYVGGISGYAGSNVRYCLNGGYVQSNGGGVGGIAGYGSSTYVTYNLNVNNVKGSSNTAAIVGSGSANTTYNYWDKQMCPTTYIHGTTSNTTCAKTTAQLVGTTQPSATYFTSTSGLYPIPKGLGDSLGAKLAATPIFLNDPENVDSTRTNFSVGTANGVSWTSSRPSIISVSGSNATVNDYGITLFTGTTGGLEKHIWIINKPVFCGGSGTQADPYLICRHQTLDSLAQYVNMGIDFAGQYFRVVNDLDLSSYSNWRVIGNSTNYPFKGHFDGNNHTISNLTITGTNSYSGLFGKVMGNSATDKADIHHLTVSGTVSGGQYTGGLVGYASYTNFKKITNEVAVSGSSSSHGGVAGEAYYNCTFDSCLNTATIAGSQFTGGIVGGTTSNYYCAIRNSRNEGAISGTSNYIGGIIGYQCNYGSIRNCQNTAAITGSQYTGGIAGCQSSYDTIEYCYNEGAITSTSSYVGGIVGSKSTSGYIQYCRNTAVVRGTQYLGGIAGSMSSSQFITNSSNTGDVTGTSSYVGGIVGSFSHNSSSLTDSYEVKNDTNSGVISGTYKVGGIVGNGSYCRIRFCQNLGDVNGTSYHVGGIVGYNNSYCLVSGSDNYGNVTSTHTGNSYTGTSVGVGGIVGQSNYNSAANVATIDSCNNYGDVRSSAYVTGGIVGMNYYYGHVNKSFNYGKVTGTCYVGGVAGLNRGYNSTTELNNAHVMACGNSGDVTGTNYVGGVVGRNGYESNGYYSYVETSINHGRVSGNSYVGGIVGQNYGTSGYAARVRGCLNAGVVEAATNYAGGISGQTYSSTSYGIVEYCLNVGNVKTSGAYKGGVEANTVAPTSSYFDTLMCPAQYYYGTTAATTATGQRTSALTDGTFNPSATYFTATAGLYPRPTVIADKPMAILAATPVFLDEPTPDHVEKVTTCYTLGTGNNVSWTSDDPTVTAISGSNGVPMSVGNTTIIAHKDSLKKEVDVAITSVPPTTPFTYTTIIDTIGKHISGYMPSLTGSCVYFSPDLPDGLVVDPNTGEISGMVLDTIKTSFHVVASCTGCVMSQAIVNCTIVPMRLCVNSTYTLPAGEEWYYDKNLTRPVSGTSITVMDTTVIYAKVAPVPVATDFSYTGSAQTYTVPANADSAFLQVWGAQGGTYNASYVAGGKGGYSEGVIKNVAGQNIYVYVGGKGGYGTNSTYTAVSGGGWNGGGSAAYLGGAGGGATDMRIAGNTLYARLIVAGGGGGAYAYSSSYRAAGGAGGGVTGVDGSYYNNGTSYTGKGGTQTAGGARGTSPSGTTYYGNAGDFGIGGNTGYKYNSTSYYSNGAGGGGWYGGGAAGNYNGTSYSSYCDGGGGGSGYVYTAATASNYPSGCLLNSNYYLTNAQTIDGEHQFPAIDGTTETGHEGDGYARITAYLHPSTKMVIINTLPEVTAAISGDTNICGSGAQAKLKIHFTGGAPYTYRITGDASDRTANNDNVEIMVSPTTSTVYNVTYVRSNVSGCEGSALGLAIVDLCGDSVICAGDTVTLPSEYTWYTDAGLTNRLNRNKVVPSVSTTYYRSGGATYNVVVMPRATATLLDTVYDACADSTAELTIYFTGNAPFRYRLTGDVADRVSNYNTTRVTVHTDTSAFYNIISFSDASPCSGTIIRSHAEVMLCNQPLICAGDTVWLPAGQWYYDANHTQPVTTPFVVPSVTTTYYAAPAFTIDYNYTGSTQVLNIPGGVDTLFLQVWGAQGGGRLTYNNSDHGFAGNGGYSEGKLAVNGLTNLYINVGGAGDASPATGSGIARGGWNGGGTTWGSSNIEPAGGGGGATDISAQGVAGTSSWNTTNHLYSRIIVAGGGGGGGEDSGDEGGYGGGLTGGNGFNTGGGQTSGGTGAVFGSGASAPNDGGAGGGGWYGGGCTNGSQTIPSSYTGNDNNGGAGGSGYVYTAATASNYPSGCLLNSNYYLVDARTVAGNQEFPAIDGTTETGHAGDGHARITYKGSPMPEFKVIVHPIPTITISDKVDTICDNESDTIDITFTGTAPFFYRLLGDTADRVTFNNHEQIIVRPEQSTDYRIISFNDITCDGNIVSQYTRVVVCDQPIICDGDTVHLPAGNWYYDSLFTRPILLPFVTPHVTTTYYKQATPSAIAFTVSVNQSVATLQQNSFNICDNDSAVLNISFVGAPPFRYRITGDVADRVTYNFNESIVVRPDSSITYVITSFSDAQCSGTIANNYVNVTYCDNPIVCQGDTVWLPAVSGKWYYDEQLTMPIDTPYIVVAYNSMSVYTGIKVNDTIDFHYIGSTQVYNIPVGTDTVFMQVWGAQGGDVINGYSGNSWYGGKGGYSEGKMVVTAGDVLNIYVGGKGGSGTSGIGQNSGGWNGGGDGGNNTSTSFFTAGGGGGASDIRVNSTSLNARVIVAGGGGGTGYGASSNTYAGGNGGGVSGTQGTYSSSYQNRMGSPGTQTAGGSRGTQSTDGTNGAFGIGGTGGGTSGSGGGGGGGWYGGGGGNYGAPYSGCGGGGSGFVYTTANANCQLPSSYYLFDAQTIAGNTAFPDTSFSGITETGHVGNGYARIMAKGERSIPLKITVHPVYRDTIKDTICAGQVKGYEDSTYTVTGNYTHLHNSVYGCDSITVLRLFVRDTFRTVRNETICRNQTYTYTGNAGNVISYIPRRTGFNDTTLHINDTFRTVRYDTICRDGMFTYGNNLITYRPTNANLYDTTIIYLHQSVRNCDSNVVIRLHINDTFRTVRYDTICRNATFSYTGNNGNVINYTPNRTNFHDTVILTTNHTIHNCDSNIEIRLHINDTFRTTRYDTICRSDVFTYGNNIFTYRPTDANLYDTTIIYRHPTVRNCDSNVVIRLHINDTFRTVRYDTICRSDVFTYGNNLITYRPTDANLYDTTIMYLHQSVRNCDSNVVIRLHINDTFRTVRYDTICRNATFSYTGNNGNVINYTPNRTNFHDTVILTTNHTIHNCDSNIEIHLHINDTFRSVRYDTICRNATFSYTGNNGNVINYTPNRTNFHDTVILTTNRTIHNCDSNIEIHLHINDTFRTTRYDTICRNATFSYTGNNGNVINYTPNRTNFHDTVILTTNRTIHNCDSNIEIHLHINDTFRTVRYDTICRSDEFVYGNNIFTYRPTDANLYDTTIMYLHQSVRNCDSNVVIRLHINDTFRTVRYDTICTYRPTDANLYDTTIMYLHQSVRNCDSNVVIRLHINDTFRTVRYDTICRNATFSYTGNNGNVINYTPNRTNFHDTVILTTNHTIHNCDSNIEIRLHINDTFRTTRYDTICRDGMFTYGNNLITYRPTNANLYDTTIIYRHQTVRNCDSNVVIRLHINDTFRTTRYDTICRDGMFTYGNNLITYRPTDANLYDTTIMYLHQSVRNCDSNVVIRLHMYVTIPSAVTLHSATQATMET